MCINYTKIALSNFIRSTSSFHLFTLFYPWSIREKPEKTRIKNTDTCSRRYPLYDYCPALEIPDDKGEEKSRVTKVSPATCQLERLIRVYRGGKKLEGSEVNGKSSRYGCEYECFWRIKMRARHGRRRCHVAS